MRFSDFASRSARGSSCVRAYLGYTGMRWWETEGRRHAGMKRVKSGAGWACTRLFRHRRAGVGGREPLADCGQRHAGRHHAAVRPDGGLGTMADYQLHAGAGHHRSGGHVPLATLLGAPARVHRACVLLVGALPTCSLPTSACCWRAACSRLSPRACSCPSCRPSP